MEGSTPFLADACFVPFVAVATAFVLVATAEPPLAEGGLMIGIGVLVFFAEEFDVERFVFESGISYFQVPEGIR